MLLIPFILIDIILILAPIAFFVAKKQNPFQELGLKKLSLKDFLKKSVLTYANLIVFSLIIAIVLSLIGLNDLVKVDEVIQEILTLSPILIIYLLVVRVLAEEVFFRGFLVNKIGIIPSSIVFGLAHVGYGSIAQVIGAGLLGLVLAYTFKKNQNLIPNIVAHSIYNLTILFV
ncbi:MAG: CPBP family intramembrane metalloprotease [archaeon]|nr:CPBP family intramembrane metalloprotease [archaeon]